MKVGIVKVAHIVIKCPNCGHLIIRYDAASSLLDKIYLEEYQKEVKGKVQCGPCGEYFLLPDTSNIDWLDWREDNKD